MQQLTEIERNILFASIIGDGEITKRYPGSRRRNNSYREHYGIQQEEYRRWKHSFLKDLLYLLPQNQELKSRSLPLFTELYSHFYDERGNKQIPYMLLDECKHLFFPAILYMDDGSLCITPRINHRLQRIYVTPHIYLYLQNYPVNQLQLLQKHLAACFQFDFKIYKRKDGFGHILRYTTTAQSIEFLERLEPVTKTCFSMYYKTNWPWRLERETLHYKKSYPDYEVIVSSPERFKPYSIQEIEQIISMKTGGFTDQMIATQLQRSYWSVVHKIKELRRNSLL